jgi:hypothetical protein
MLNAMKAEETGSPPAPECPAILRHIDPGHAPERAAAPANPLTFQRIHLTFQRIDAWFECGMRLASEKRQCKVICENRKFWAKRPGAQTWSALVLSSLFCQRTGIPERVWLQSN